MHSWTPGRLNSHLSPEAKALDDKFLLTTDTVEFIRSHPKMFIPHQTIAAEYLVNTVAEMAALRGGEEVVVSRCQNWWKVVSKTDWLLNESIHKRPSAFCDMVPFPEGGLFAFYPEVLLTAYADAVISTTPSEAESIPPTFIPSTTILEWLTPRFGRAVGFELSEPQGQRLWQA
jgi:hypothetical protein